MNDPGNKNWCDTHGLDLPCPKCQEGRQKEREFAERFGGGFTKYILQYADWNNWKCQECGVEWQLIDGTPKENNMNFCPNCGRKIIECVDELEV